MSDSGVATSHTLPEKSDTLPEQVWPTLERGGGLFRAVDQIELKLIVPEAGQDQLLSVLGADRRSARTRQLYLFDTADMDLARRGLIVRARSKRSGSCDFTIKLRRPSPVELSGKLRRSGNLDLEIDVLPGTTVWSAALTRRLDSSELNAVLVARRPIRSLLSREQRKLLRKVTVRDIDVSTKCSPARATRVRRSPAGFWSTGESI